jgi:hypothetical protein
MKSIFVVQTLASRSPELSDCPGTLIPVNYLQSSIRTIITVITPIQNQPW